MILKWLVWWDISNEEPIWLTGLFVIQIPGVESVHELHVWRLNQRKTIASAHIVVDGKTVENFQDKAKVIMECLHAYGIHNATLQPEVMPRPSSDTMEPIGQVSTEESTEIRRRPSQCQLECSSLCGGMRCCSPVELWVKLFFLYYLFLIRCFFHFLFSLASHVLWFDDGRFFYCLQGGLCFGFIFSPPNFVFPLRSGVVVEDRRCIFLVVEYFVQRGLYNRDLWSRAEELIFDESLGSIELTLEYFLFFSFSVFSNLFFVNLRGKKEETPLQHE